MGRRKAKTALITFIITFLVMALLAGFVCFKLVSAKNEIISKLEEQKADVQAYAFARDLRANTIITPADITKIDIKNISRASGMYLIYEGSRNVHYVASVDNTGTENVSETFYSLNEDIVGRIVKENVSKNTPVLDSLLYAKDEKAPKIDVRLQEFNFLQIPSDLNTGDYIDIRIQFPTGENYRVVTAKRVEKSHMEDNDGIGAYTIFVKLNEEEILVMASAVIEAYMQEGVKLYATKYADPASQLFNESIVDYVELYDKALQSAMEVEEYNRVVNSFSGDFELRFEDYHDLEEAVKDEYRLRIEPVKEEDITDEIIVSYSGIREEHVKAIREAKAANDDNVLNYYRAMRVQTVNTIKSTYPVKQEVLTVLRNNPDIVSTVYAFYEEMYVANASRYDAYRELEEAYQNAPTEKGWNNDIKTKDEILQEMKTLLEQRASNVNDSVISEQEKQRSDRRQYLSKLLGISIGEED